MPELMLHRALTVGTLLTVASLAGCGASDSQGSNGGAGVGAGAGTASSAGSPTSGGASGSSEGGNTTQGGSTAAGAGSSQGGSTGAAGASSSAGEAGLPAIDPSTNLIALTPEQQGQFCDWAAAQLGGYGKFNQCPGGGSNTVYKDQADCVSQAFLFNCTDKITVAQLEECTQAQGLTGGCTFPEAHCHWLLCR